MTKLTEEEIMRLHNSILKDAEDLILWLQEEIDLLKEEEQIIKVLKKYEGRVIRKGIFEKAKFAGYARPPPDWSRIGVGGWSMQKGVKEYAPYELTCNFAASIIYNFHQIILRLCSNISMQREIFFKERKKVFRIIFRATRAESMAEKSRKEKYKRAIEVYTPVYKKINKICDLCFEIEKVICKFDKEMSGFGGEMRFAKNFREEPERIYDYLKEVYAMLEEKNKIAKEIFEIEKYGNKLLSKFSPIKKEEMKKFFKEVLRQRIYP